MVNGWVENTYFQRDSANSGNGSENKTSLYCMCVNDSMRGNIYKGVH